MRKTIVAAFAAAALLSIGCVSTVNDSHTFALSYGKDSVAGRYPRTLDQVYQAAVAVITVNGVIMNEYIPHDNTNAVRSLLGRVNDRKVWVRVESIDPKVTQVDVQARTKWGTRDLDLVHEIEKEIALKLVQ
ncbi:MAG: DUF3568 family protein [Verrucomicrobiota bacterium]